MLQIKRDRSLPKLSAVSFDVYPFESVLQILMIVTTMLIVVTTILTRVIAISIIKFALFQISHSHPSQTHESSQVTPGKEPTAYRKQVAPTELYRTYDLCTMIIISSKSCRYVLWRTNKTIITGRRFIYNEEFH